MLIVSFTPSFNSLHLFLQKLVSVTAQPAKSRTQRLLAAPPATSNGKLPNGKLPNGELPPPVAAISRPSVVPPIAEDNTGTSPASNEAIPTGGVPRQPSPLHNETQLEDLPEIPTPAAAEPEVEVKLPLETAVLPTSPSSPQVATPSVDAVANPEEVDTPSGHDTPGVEHLNQEQNQILVQAAPADMFCKEKTSRRRTLWNTFLDILRCR